MKASVFIFHLVMVPVLILAALPRGELRADGPYGPIVYPYGRISSSTPLFIWEDLYTPREAKGGAQFKISIRLKGGDDTPSLARILVPELHRGFYYAYRWENPLALGSYEYTIERLVAGTPVKARRYHSFSYPACGGFTLVAREKTHGEDLGPGAQARLLALARENADNGCNALFFAGAGAVCAGVGALFYFALDLGIAGTIVAAVSLAGAAAGTGAACYYGARYFIVKGEMKDIARIDSHTSLRGALEDGVFYAAVESKL